MANQKAWETDNFVGFRHQIRHGIFGKDVHDEMRIQTAKNLFKDYMWTPIKESFKEFWKGQNKTTSIAGKATIITTAAALVLANYLILTKTSARNHKTERTTGNKPQEVKKQ